jgi:hypothetical protein
MKNRSGTYGKTRKTLPIEGGGKRVGVKGLTGVARRLRKHSTDTEGHLWRYLRDRFFSLMLADVSFAGVSVIGGLSREKNVKPGERFEGIIHLKNNGDGSCQVKIYHTDYLFYADGRNIYGEPGGISRSNANWISLSPVRLTVPPKETASVSYAVQVPDAPDLKGSYWSMVMVEAIPESSPESLTEEKGKVKVGIQTIMRYGIQIITNIGGTGERRIRFLDKKLISQDGKRVFQFDIENTGERSLSPSVWVELYSKDGMNTGRFESSRLRIYPGCSVQHKVDFTDVPKGKYKALVVADNGDENVFGAQYDLEME